jgi:UDP-N-acetylglucosamine 1-carboxyvinyltransferase
MVHQTREMCYREADLNRSTTTMGILRITGQTPLTGNITISGRKNAALKLIAASLLSDKPVTLHRVPDIGDVRVMLSILEHMGAHIEKQGDSLTIHTASITDPTIPTDLAQKLRASLVLVGPLLGRFGKAIFPHPGGCVIGKRSIRPHLAAFEDLGAEIHFDGDIYILTAPQLRGKKIYMKERSVTGTENVIMAACRAEGMTQIHNAAEEDHIINLAGLLRSMGYSINGDGSATITIEGKPDFVTNAAECTLIADEIEIGTYAVATVITGGNVTLEQVGNYESLMPILSKLDDFNVQYKYDASAQTLHVLPSPNLSAANVQTNPWPGFPPDLQSPFTVLATQAKGTSLIHDWMYEGRLYFVDLLEKMGADITICDPHRVIVHGPTELYKSSVITPDLRAGAALILAALAAEGTSVIEQVELIDRGYVAIDEKLRSLGAKIIRE